MLCCVICCVVLYVMTCAMLCPRLLQRAVPVGERRAVSSLWFNPSLDMLLVGDSAGVVRFLSYLFIYVINICMYMYVRSIYVCMHVSTYVWSYHCVFLCLSLCLHLSLPVCIPHYFSLCKTVCIHPPTRSSDTHLQ